MKNRAAVPASATAKNLRESRLTEKGIATATRYRTMAAPGQRATAPGTMASRNPQLPARAPGSSRADQDSTNGTAKTTPVVAYAATVIQNRPTISSGMLCGLSAKRAFPYNNGFRFGPGER
jgi:hypothetical protein